MRRNKSSVVVKGQASIHQEIKGFDSYTVTLGDRMRGERATMGKSLEDIHKEIKLRVEILQGIENSDLSVFPSPSFIAGYVRSYSSYLNMDPEECFQLFCLESGFIGLKSEINGTKNNRKRIVKSTKLLDDPILNPKIPFKPTPASVFYNISVSGIVSLIVLMAMILGLGYGGLAVLKEVQKVQLSPGNEIPSINQSVARPTFTNNNIRGIGIKKLTKFKDSDLKDFYRPTELLVPLFTPRDGPISVIDTENIGNFIQTKAFSNAEIIIAAQPQVTKIVSATVDVVALKPAWVRVFDPDGNILFENILDSGQRYRVPETAKSAMMRVGNSGSVYIMIGESLYGPVGTATNVARRVSLNADIVLKKYTLVENKLEKPLDPPVNIELTAQAIE